jgi:Ca2+-binding EF-hand superfamily protein
MDDQVKIIMQTWENQTDSKKELVFTWTDKNQDGKISLDEFRQLAVMSGVFENEANLTKAFNDVDVNGDLHMEL